MDWIATRFKDCLCPVCLQQVADGLLGPETSQLDRARIEGVGEGKV